MKRLFCIVLGFLSIEAALASVEIDTGLQEMERHLEEKVEKQLGRLFPAIPVVVSVKIKPALAVAKKPKGESKEADKAEAEKDAKDAEGMESPFTDLGYLPFPVEMGSDGSRNGAAAIPMFRRFQRFESTSVLLQTAPTVDDETIELIKTSVGEALDGYAPNIQVTKVDAKGGSMKPFEGARTQKLEDEKNGIGTNQILISVLQLLSSLFLSLALGFVAWYMRKGAGVIAEGIRALGNTFGKKDEDPNGLNGALNLGGGNTLSLKTAHDASAAYERNLLAVKRALDDQPELVAQELQASPEDADGLRWILPALEPTEQESLRKWLGPNKTRQLLALAGAVAEGVEGALDARYRWLQRFVERLALRRVRGGSPVDAALGSELALEISTIGVTDIEAWVNTREDAAAWRVASEFIPTERFARLLEKMDNAKWLQLADAAGAPPKEMTAAGKALVDARKEKNPEAAKRSDLRKDYFQRILTDPLTSALKRRPLAEQDLMIEALGEHHEDLVHALEQRFWTTRQLRRVPEDRLSRAFRALSTDDKVKLVAALPSGDVERFISWLPEGNVKLIVSDKVKKINQRNDKHEIGEMTEFAQRFIENLRLACAAGEFELESGTPEAKPRLRKAA